MLLKLKRVKRGMYRLGVFRIDYIHPKLWVVYDESNLPFNFPLIVFNSRSLKTTKEWIAKQLA